MTHRNKILADRIVAKPIAFLLNGLARILGTLMRRDHSVTSTNVRRIVVAKLLGMGSILQATPLLRALKQRYPAAKLIFVTMHSNRELLNRLPWVDEVLTLDDRNLFAMAATTFGTVATLIGQRADLYFDLELYSAFASLLALFAITRNRVGFYRHSVAFKNGIYTHLIYFNTRMPVRRLYLQLGRVVGVASDSSDLTGPIRVDDADRISVRDLLSHTWGWRPEEPYIVVNPNASDLLLERRWPTDYMVETVNRLASLGNQLALIGAKDEISYVESIVGRLAPETRARVVDTAGRLTIGQLLALLEGAGCVLSNDTGPMHMAVALRRPTVCLFGPASPEHLGHSLQYVENFYGRVFCSPCVHESDPPPCNGNNICMQKIKPERVIDSVVRLLGNNSNTNTYETFEQTNHGPIPSDAPDGSPLGLVVRASLRSGQQ